MPVGAEFTLYLPPYAAHSDRSRCLAAQKASACSYADLRRGHVDDEGEGGNQRWNNSALITDVAYFPQSSEALVLSVAASELVGEFVSHDEYSYATTPPTYIDTIYGSAYNVTYHVYESATFKPTAAGAALLLLLTVWHGLRGGVLVLCNHLRHDKQGLDTTCSRKPACLAWTPCSSASAARGHAAAGTYSPVHWEGWPAIQISVQGNRLALVAT